VHSRPASTPAFAASSAPAHTHINVTLSFSMARFSQLTSAVVGALSRRKALVVTPVTTMTLSSGTCSGSGSS